MNKNTKAKAQLKYKGVILGTSEPIVITPLKERKPLPSCMGQKVVIKRQGPWNPLKISHKKNSVFKEHKARERKARAYGTALAQSNWLGNGFTGIYSGGGIETNRRKH